MATLSITARSGTKTSLEGRVFKVRGRIVTVSGDLSTLRCDTAEIQPNDSDTAEVVLTVRATDGTPLPGIPAAQCVFSSTESVTLTQPTGVTDRNGQISAFVAGTISGSTIISAEVVGVAIARTVTIAFATEQLSLVAETAAFAITGTDATLSQRRELVADSAAVAITGADATLAYSEEDPSALISPVFYSDFTTATGTTASALNDGGKWNVYGSGGEVMSAAGLDFPDNLENVVLVPWTVGAGTGIWRVGPPYGGGFGSLAVGSTRTYRYFFRNVQPDSTVDEQTHPFQDGSADSDTNWTLQIYNHPTGGGFGALNPGTYRIGHGFWDNVAPYNTFIGPVLYKHHTYRFEHSLERVTTTTFRFTTRIYDEAISKTVPVYTGDDFTAGNLGLETLTDYFASNTLTINDDTMFPGLNIGVNDLDSEVGDYAYEGGVAVWDNQVDTAVYGEVTGEAPNYNATPLLLSAPWGTTTGTSASALTDGGRWNGPNSGFGYDTGGGAVETLTSLGLTEPPELSTLDSALVTRATEAAGYGQTLTAEYDAGAPVSGDTYYFRVYMACIQPNATGDATAGNIEHGYESADTGGGDGWNLIRLPKSDGTWRLVFRDITSGYRYCAWDLVLNKNTLYRVEHKLTYGASTYTVDIRIYDTTGTLIGTSRDFWQWLPSENTSLRLHTAALSYTGANHRYVRIGNNGPSSNYPGVPGVGTLPNAGDGMHVVAAFAFSKRNWCGPYNANEYAAFNPMFLVDFGTALGVTSTAIGDGGVLDTLSPDFEDNGEVVVAEPSENWRTTNMLRVYSATGIRDGYLEIKHTTMGEMAENEVRNYRFAVVIKAPNSAGGATDYSHHGIQDGYPSGAASNQNWNFTDVTGDANPTTDATYETQWRARTIIDGPDQFEIDNTVTPTLLDKHVKYTFEYQIVRGSGANTNSFQIRSWIYDSAGVLLKSPADWKSSTYGGETMATGRWYPFNMLSSTTSIGFGLNGILGTFPLHHSNQGEIAAVSSVSNPHLTAGTSIRPYPSCIGEF